MSGKKTPHAQGTGAGLRTVDPGQIDSVAKSKNSARQLPLYWQWRWLTDGRIATVEQFGDGWHVIIERSTSAIVPTKEAAFLFLDNFKGAGR